MTPAVAVQYSSASYDFNSIDSPSESYMDSNFLECGPTPSTVINNQYTMVGSVGGDVCGDDPSLKRHVETIGSNGKPRYLLELTVASIIIFTIAMAVYNAYTLSLAKSSLLFYDMDVPVGKPIDPKITVPVGVPIPENSMPAAIGSLVESVNSLPTSACNIAGHSHGNVLNMPNLIFLWVSHYQTTQPILPLNLVKGDDLFCYRCVLDFSDEKIGNDEVYVDLGDKEFAQKNRYSLHPSDNVYFLSKTDRRLKLLKRILNGKATVEERLDWEKHVDLNAQAVARHLPPFLASYLHSLVGSGSAHVQNIDQIMQNTHNHNQLLPDLNPFSVPIPIPVLQLRDLTEAERQTAANEINQQINDMAGHVDYTTLARRLVANRNTVDIAQILTLLQLNHAAMIFDVLDRVTQLLVTQHLGFAYFDQILNYLENNNRIDGTWINQFLPFNNIHAAPPIGVNPEFHNFYMHLVEMHRLHMVHRNQNAMFNGIPEIVNNPQIFHHVAPVDIMNGVTFLLNPPGAVVGPANIRDFTYITAAYLGAIVHGNPEIIREVIGRIIRLKYPIEIRNNVLIHFLNGLGINDIAILLKYEDIMRMLADSGFDLEKVASAFIEQENNMSPSAYSNFLMAYINLLNENQQAVFHSALPYTILKLLYNEREGGVDGEFPRMVFPRMIITTVDGQWYSIAINHHEPLVGGHHVINGPDLGLAAYTYIRDTILGTLMFLIERRQYEIVTTLIDQFPRGIIPLLRDMFINNHMPVLLTGYMHHLYTTHHHMAYVVANNLAIDNLEDYAIIIAPFFQVNGEFALAPGDLNIIMSFLPQEWTNKVIYHIIAWFINHQNVDTVIAIAQRMIHTDFWNHIEEYITAEPAQVWFARRVLPHINLTELKKAQIRGKFKLRENDVGRANEEHVGWFSSLISRLFGKNCCCQLQVQPNQHAPPPYIEEYSWLKGDKSKEKQVEEEKE